MQAAPTRDERPLNLNEATLKQYPATSSGAAWRIVRLAARDPHTARTILMREFEVYCPRIEETRRVAMRHLSRAQRAAALVSGNESTRRRIVRVELFTSYCFVRFDLAHRRWHECFDLAGARGIVCAGNLPVAVPHELVAHVRSQERNGAIPLMTTVHELLKVGEQVKITAGPFAGFDALVERLPNVPLGLLDESVRVGLLVGLFGRQSLIEVEFGFVERKR